MGRVHVHLEVVRLAKYRVKESFEHYPTDGDPDKPTPVVANAGDVVDNIHPSSIDGLLADGRIEEVGKKSTAGEG